MVLPSDQPRNQSNRSLTGVLQPTPMGSLCHGSEDFAHRGLFGPAPLHCVAIRAQGDHRHGVVTSRPRQVVNAIDRQNRFAPLGHIPGAASRSPGFRSAPRTASAPLCGRHDRELTEFPYGALEAAAR
jgi:hypothetical protein